MSERLNIVQMPLDPRPIAAISFGAGPAAMGYAIGVGGVSRILSYCENGEMAPVPWFAVYLSGEIIARVPAYMVVVTYQPGAEGTLQ